MISNTIKTDFSSGSLDSSLQGRTDLPIYGRAVAKAVNWLVYATGPMKYRTGFRLVHTTRRNQDAVLIPFQYNDAESYAIEATPGYFRFYRNESIITEGAKNVTGITAAAPGVVTIASHGWSNGDEVVLEGITGMIELNNRSFVVRNATTNTFTLEDIYGASVDTSGYTAYASGGTASRVYEIKTPYEADWLDLLQHTQNANLMYLTSRRYEQRKLTRTSHTTWTLDRFARVNDPFTAAKTITGATQANPCSITVTSHGWATGDQVFIDSVVGMTELNNGWYTITSTGVNTFTLDGVDSSAYTAYSSGGKAERLSDGKYPRAVAFTDDSRIVYGGSEDNPETLWFSRGPSAGAIRFDDFTTGSADTDATTFTLAPIHGQADVIQWLGYSDKFLLAGTFGTVRRIYGATPEDPITPTSITAKSSNVHGTKATKPAVSGPLAFYIQRGGKYVRSYEYDFNVDGFFPVNRNLLNEEILRKRAAKIVDVRAEQDMLYAVVEDGKLAGHTYNAKENKAGWHEHIAGGTRAKILDAASIPRVTGNDRLWVVVERTTSSGTLRTVEVQTDFPDYPVRDDYNTLARDQSAEETAYKNWMYEMQKEAVHLDNAYTYDGSINAGGTLTPGAGATTIGTTDVVFTTGSALFSASDVGRELRKKFDIYGDGGGRAVITEYTSSTSVKCKITEAFDSVTAISAGDWEFTTSTVTGLWLFEGDSLAVYRDGAYVNDFTVTNGAITLDSQGAIIHVGNRYLGFIKSVSLEQGGVSGPAVNKPKDVAAVYARVQNTATGLKYGTSFYDLTDFNFRSAKDISSRPVPLRSGLAEQRYSDGWSRDKHLYVVQDLPQPATLLSLDVHAVVTDES